jgi:hypothetical protein
VKHFNALEKLDMKSDIELTDKDLQAIVDKYEGQADEE